MGYFWPTDVDLDDLRSPKDVMVQAALELQKRSTKLVADVVERPLTDRLMLQFNVANQSASLVITLLEAAHRLQGPYPVVLIPPAADIPEFLQRTHVVPGRRAFALPLTIFGGDTPDRTVENEWVSATPGEFAQKLSQILRSDEVKWRLLSLLAPEKIVEHSERATESADPEGAAGTE